LAHHHCSCRFSLVACRLSLVACRLSLVACRLSLFSLFVRAINKWQKKQINF
jgi:hypothetical protein